MEKIRPSRFRPCVMLYLKEEKKALYSVCTEKLVPERLGHKQ